MLETSIFRKLSYFRKLLLIYFLFEILLDEMWIVSHKRAYDKNYLTKAFRLRTLAYFVGKNNFIDDLIFNTK